MAVYNGARYLAQAVDSVLNQALGDLEFVIVNDGSTDETPGVLASYDDPRIVVVENDGNIGLTRSLNRGIRASRAPLIARQDADDVSLPRRLEKQVAYLEDHQSVGLVGCGSKWVDGENRLIREWQPVTDPTEIQQVLLSSVPFLHGTFMFRRACLPDSVGYDEGIPVAQDCDLLLRLSERWDVANLSEVLYVHRRHEDTVTAKRSIDQQRYLQLARRAAIQRRLEYGWGRLGLVRAEIPEWVRAADRRWLACRYVWWSAGSRQMSKRLALQFLLIALFLDPTGPDVRQYVLGILGRKLSNRV